MRSLQINGVKTDASYTKLYFRCIICKAWIGYFAGGIREKILNVHGLMVITMYHRLMSVQLFPFSRWKDSSSCKK